MTGIKKGWNEMPMLWSDRGVNEHLHGYLGPGYMTRSSAINS
jgi:hypothetical protein